MKKALLLIFSTVFILTSCTGSRWDQDRTPETESSPSMILSGGAQDVTGNTESIATPNTYSWTRN